MKPVLKALVVASTLALAAGAAEARDLRLAPGAPPVHPAYAMYKKLVENLPKETNGAYTGTILGPEVVNIFQVKQALQSSLAEVGNLLPLYVPADLPSTALAGDLAFQATSPYAMAAAMTEYVVTCKDCQQEFKKLGAVYTGSGSSDVYVILSTKPARSLKELKGLRLRSGGAPYARWAEAAGAAPTQVPVSDQFEAISQGVLDGSMASIQDLLSYRLIDIVKYVIDLPLGTYHATVDFAVATAAWKEMSPEQRAGFVRAANIANVAFTQDWGYDRSGKARKAAKEAGIEFIKPSQDMLDQIEKFRANDIEAATKLSKSQLGLDNGAEKIERFQALTKKWTKIAEELNNDPAAITQRIQKEVWDKVDYSTYGL